jgi:hypothetical protein
VPVVADVDADLADGGLEDRVPEVPGPEVELLPEALDVRDVRLAVLAQVLAVGVDDRGGVVVDARAWASSSYIGTTRTMPVCLARSCIRFVVGPSGMSSVYA